MKHLKTKWLIGVDCDGVLTDYKCYFSATGRLFKVFNSKDSYVFKALHKEGHLIYVISSDEEGFPILSARAKAWHVQAVPSADKRGILLSLKKKHEGMYDKVCFIGNGPEDLVAIDLVDNFFAPSDARTEVQNHEKVSVLKTAGGEGVMDDVLEELQKLS